MKKTGNKNIHVNIPLNLVCNMKCNFCTFGETINSGKKVYLETLNNKIKFNDFINAIFFEVNILNDIVFSITFVGGEPTLSYRTFSFFMRGLLNSKYNKYIKEFLFYTNGVELQSFLEKGIEEFGNVFKNKFKFVINIQGIGKEYKVIHGIEKENSIFFLKKVLKSVGFLEKNKYNYTISILLNRINFRTNYMNKFILFLYKNNIKNIEFGFLIKEGKAKENSDNLIINFFDNNFLEKLKRFKKFIDIFNNKGMNYKLLEGMPSCIQDFFDYDYISENNAYGTYNKIFKILKMYSDNFTKQEFKNFYDKLNILLVKLYESKKDINNKCASCVRKNTCIYIASENFGIIN